MRKLFTLILALIGGIVIGQKKPSINKAKSYFDKGQYAEAQMEIDRATTYEKTAINPKTWFYRGMIYAALDTALKQDNAMQTSLESFSKTLELDPEQKKVSEIDLTTGSISNVDSKLDGYFGYYFNKAIESYNTENMLDATTNFELANTIKPSDTVSMLNAGLSASISGDQERADRNFEKCAKAGLKEKNIYLQLYNNDFQAERYDEAITHIKRAKEIFPNDTDFSRYEINIYLKIGRAEEAKKELLKALVNEPTNPDLHFSLGVLEEESGNIEAAKVAYQKALEVESNHYNSTFNIGVLGFNEANEIIKERNNLKYDKEYQRKNAELTKKIKVKLNEILPLWEKLYKMQEDDQTVLETLAYIYNFLEMKEKAAEIKAKKK